MNIGKLMANKWVWAGVVLLLVIVVFVWGLPNWVLFCVPLYLLYLIVCFVGRLIGILRGKGAAGDARAGKKMKAKEWLIFMGTIGVGAIFVFLGVCFVPIRYFYNQDPGNLANATVSYMYIFEAPDWLPYRGIIYAGQILMAAYPAYLLIRFVRWAIKKVKK